MDHVAIPAGLPDLGLPFSWGIRHGDLLFVAGQGPLGPDGKVVPGDIRAQTRLTLENFRNVVEAAGSSLAHVLSTTVYLADLGDARAMNEVYADVFRTEPRPARATVGAALLFGMKVEVQGIAYVPGRGAPGASL
jgi:2-iminobutanoate/2-iminopropanoate deaminase